MSPDSNEYIAADRKPSATLSNYFLNSRSLDVWELQAAAPNAFRLLWVIAYRTRYSSGFNRHGLDTGEAMLGDFYAFGMSEQEYRTAKKFLAKWGFATFRITPKGTIARLMDTRAFEVIPIPLNTQNNRQLTPSQRTPNGQLTTTDRSVDGIRAIDPDKASGAESNPASSSPVRQPTKSKKLSKAQKEIADRFETALGVQWVNDAGKWVNLIKPIRANASVLLPIWRTQSRKAALKH